MEATGKTLCLPVVLGVTGHRDPRPQDQEVLKKAVELVIRGLKEGPAGEYLVLASALAEGADQLAAEVALDLEPIPLVAIAPMPLQEYEKTFDTEEGKRRLHDMWARAALRIELPQVRVEGETPSNEAQFEQLGLVLSRYSHVLLALWDGIDGGPARGGTAQIVAMRRLGERAVASAGFRASELFAGAPPLLELTRSGPVLQIYTPRLSKERGGEYQFGMSHEPGAVLGLPDVISSAKVPIKSPAELRDATEENFSSFALAQRDFLQMAKANQHMAEAAQQYPVLCESHEEYLSPAEVKQSEALRMLNSVQARADVAAAYFQRLIIGEWSPGLPRSEGLKLARNRGKKLPHPGVLILFAMALPAAVLLYEGYAHLHWLWALLLYMAVFAGAYGFYLAVVKQREWQEHFQDYRALAEALRVQFYWAACGLPIAVSDNYLRQHADDLGWVRQALRGPALLGIAAALDAKSMDERRAAFSHWTTDQRKFFVGAEGGAGKARINELAKQWIERALMLVLSIAVVAAVATLEYDLMDRENFLHKLLVISLGLLPALAVSLIFIAESRAYEAHAHTYVRAGLLHQRAGEIAKAMDKQTETEDWPKLVLELGQEALAENARWLINHRERRIAMRVG
jgi:hypothetical protein